MTVTPSDDNPVVKMAKENLRGVLDLESFVQDLGRVGKYIRVAYNGIGAAGPEFQDLQIQVQRLGLDISKLCDKSAVTIASFKQTTETVLFELKAAYQFLLNNQEPMALDSLSELAELAEKMAKAAENLQKEFEKQEAKVMDTLEETMIRGSKERTQIKNTTEHQERTKVILKVQEDLSKEHEKLEAEFRAERQRYEKEEEMALGSMTGLFGRLVNVITSSVGLGQFRFDSLFDDVSNGVAIARHWKEKSIQKLENEKEQRKMKQAALQQMAELVHDIKVMEEKGKLSDIAANALHKASGSMKQLIHLLRQAALFWTQLREHCKGLVDDKLQQKIERFVATFSEKDRREYWSSNPFKQTMFRYISRWVALHSISSTYLDQIKLTRRDLYDYILENPTYEESKQNLKELVGDFEKDLASAYKQIEEQDFKANKQIMQLRNELQAEQKDEQKTEL